MALLESEVMRIRNELGYNVMGISAEPYIGITPTFNGVIQQYITSGAKTTSSTPTTASTSPTAQTYALASGSGFTAGDTIIIDVDARQERATAVSVSGNNVTAYTSLAHGPNTYPVVVEGGESMIRDILRVLIDLGTGGVGGARGSMVRVASRLGIKKVDEIEFFGGGAAMSQGKDPLTQLMSLREYWRDELANALGVERLNRRGGHGVSSY